MRIRSFVLISIILLVSGLFATDEEYVIIADESLIPAAEIISTLHSTEVDPEYQLTTAIVTTQSIFAAYPDTTESQAIRLYLLNEIENNANLRLALFFGDENLVPPIYDWYGNLSDDFYTTPEVYQAHPQLGTGRIVVANLTDALSVANKIRDYILNGDTGDWRSDVVLLADDAHKSGGSYSAEITHVANSNQIYQDLRSSLNVECLYGTEYTPDYSGGGWPTLPDLTNDFIDRFNSGVGWINYIGHGNETTLADELIINMGRDIDIMSAPEGKLPVWVIGSCDFGHYDNADCMSEELIKKPDGVIAMVTPTRALFIDVVANFIDRFYQNVRDYQYGLNDYRMGELLSESKLGSTEFHYHLMGDPAMRLPFPRIQPVVDTYPDQIEILAVSQVGLNSPYDLMDSHIIVKGPETEVVQIYGDNAILSYTLPGSVTYQGDFTNSVDFIAPLDMPFCDDCTASISVYSNDGSYTGNNQLIFDIPIAEPSGVIEDATGPMISVEYDGSSLSDNDILQTPFDLTLVFEDEAGINLMGALGHNIRYWVDSESNSRIITGEFSYFYGDNTAGSLEVQLDTELSGLHTLSVEAWDNANNRTLFEIALCFTDCSPGEIPSEYTWGGMTSLLTPTGITLGTDDQIYASTAGGILAYDPASNQFSTIGKDEGLGALDIYSLAKDGPGNLWLGSNTPDGSIQVYHPQFGLQRTIDHLDIQMIRKFSLDGSTAFAAYQVDNELGILEFRMDENNLPYFQNHFSNFPIQLPNILDVDQFGDSVYVTTSMGVLAGDFTQDILTSSSNWQMITNSLIPEQFISGDQPVVVTSGGLWTRDAGGVWTQQYSGFSGDILDAAFDIDSGTYAVLTTTNYYEFDAAFSLLGGFPFHIPVNSTFSCFTRGTDSVVFGVQNQGILIWDMTSRTFEQHVPNTFISNRFNALTFTAQNEMAGVSRLGAFINSNGQYLHFIPAAKAGSYLLDELGPDEFSGMSINYVRGSNTPWSILENETGNLIFSNSGIRPSNPATRGGAIEINPVSYEFTVYDTTNGILDGLNGIYNQYWSNLYLTIHQMQKDPDGNIWVVNPYSETFNHIAAIQETDGLTWSHVTAPDMGSHLPQEVAFDSFGRAWFGLRWDVPMNDNINEYADGGLRVVDTNGTIGDESDDVWLDVLNMDILPGESVWSITFDQTGQLWLITSGGVQGYTVEEDVTGLTLVPLADSPMLTYVPLFKGDRIRVDSQNNKWVTTQHSGIFVIRENLSLWPDGNGFTAGNSGLLSDVVYDVAFDNTGETAYFATEKGISSFDLAQIPPLPIVPTGDINQDGMVNVNDIVICVFIILGELDPVEAGYTIDYADMDISGALDVTDIINIIGIILGMQRSDITDISSAEVRNEGGIITVSADGPIAGVQLSIAGDFTILGNELPPGWEIYSGDDVILAFTMHPTTAEELTLCRYEGNISVKSAIISDWSAKGVNISYVPDQFDLYNPYPNPFNPVVNIRYSTAQPAKVKITIYSLLGRQVETLINSQTPAGEYVISWDASNQASGLYFVRMDAGETHFTRKLMLLK
ncbi:MAG: T9SS type A sorting domain-containing protein [FCB group bacterium]|nr:T9SS type A sorting domain-containing protein [FCB group bacterium]